VLELVALSLRRIPSERGRWRLIPLALRWSRSLLPENRSRLIWTRHGFRLQVRLGDWLGRHVYVTGEYEPATTRVVKSLLQAGDTFVDIGANIGYFSLLASRRVGPTGKVFAFEPVPQTRDELIHNVCLNRAGNVTVRDEAVADSTGEAIFFVGPADHRGTSSLRSLHDASGVLSVRKALLDDLLPPDAKVGLVKIDVEGAEYLALQGMQECLRLDRPDLIIEVTDSYLRGMGHSAAMLCEFLRDFGYRMYTIEHDCLTLLPDSHTAFPDQFNALFTVRERLPDEILASDVTRGGTNSGSRRGDDLLGAP
jgi:FkbM family methyltransferase